MDYLARESAPFSSEIWAQIDNTVVETAKKHLVCRRFLSLFGPLGAGVSTVPVNTPAKEEEQIDGFGRITGRKILELPQLYEDFTLLWREIEESEKNNWPLDLSAAAAAAQRAAKKEDNLILFGNNKLGMEGLFTAKDSHKIKRGNWKEGEDAFQDIARGIAYLAANNYLGRYALVLSPELYLELERIQPGINMLELDRIAKLVNGRVYTTGAFGAGKAVLVCAEPQYMDLAVGADLGVGYLELKDLNHSLRILETLALRIKEPNAIVNFE
ncbi:MAG: family 1 encapsulin nanocompartment shell protein [Lachnospiraceae bacterium]